MVKGINAMSYDDELDMYYDKWLAAKQLAKRLEEGPGGIMEMKQTIADKEAEIERLRSAIAERDMFIEIIGMCNEFEEFLSK